MEVYKDKQVVITHDDDKYNCNWINTRAPKNDSYMEAKLTEWISNNFAGVWPCKDQEEADKSPGMRCFIAEWSGNTFIARWAE